MPDSLPYQEPCRRKVLREDHPAVIERALISGSSSWEAGGSNPPGRGPYRLYPGLPITLYNEHGRHPPGPDGTVRGPDRKNFLLVHAFPPSPTMSTAMSCASSSISGLWPIRAYAPATVPSTVKTP